MVDMRGTLSCNRLKHKPIFVLLLRFGTKWKIISKTAIARNFWGRFFRGHNCSMYGAKKWPPKIFCQSLIFRWFLLKCKRNNMSQTHNLNFYTRYPKYQIFHISIIFIPQIWRIKLFFKMEICDILTILSAIFAL